MAAITKASGTSSHSVRCSQELWEEFTTQARENRGVSANRAMNLLMEAYVRGVIDLPRVETVISA